MNEKISIIIGTIIVFSVVTGFSIYNDYVIKESKTGTVIEKSLDVPDFEDIFIPAKNK